MLFVIRTRAAAQLPRAIRSAGAKLQQLLVAAREARSIHAEWFSLLDCADDGEYLSDESFFAYLYGAPWMLKDGLRSDLNCEYFLQSLLTGDLPNALDIGGQFFFLYARKDGDVYVHSDVCGSFPLYVMESNGLRYISPFTALIAAASEQRISLNGAAIREFHQRVAFQELASIYQGIKKLPPGFIALGAKRHTERRPAELQNLRGNVADALRIAQCAIPITLSRSDGKAAVALSGGLDSSLVTLLLLQNGIRVHAYNAQFGSLPCDESIAVRRFIHYLHAAYPAHDHPLTPVPFVPEEATLKYHECSNMLDFPLFPLAIMGCEIIRAASREGIRVVYDGNGGDEIFALPPVQAIGAPGYRHLDLWLASLRICSAKPRLASIKNLVRVAMHRAAQPKPPVDALIRRRFQAGAISQPFYSSLWQFAYLHGVRLVQPFRCALLAKHFLSENFAGSLYYAGHFRGLQREMIAQLTQGYRLDPLRKVRFDDFTSQAYQCTASEAELADRLGQARIERYNWLMPRFIERRRAEGYECSEFGVHVEAGA
jgi:hypothetical protein